MNAAVKIVIENLLAMDSPSNYATWEDAEASILEDLGEHEEAEYLACGGFDGMIQSWFEAGD